MCGEGSSDPRWHSDGAALVLDQPEDDDCATLTIRTNPATIVVRAAVFFSIAKCQSMAKRVEEFLAAGISFFGVVGSNLFC